MSNVNDSLKNRFWTKEKHFERNIWTTSSDQNVILFALPYAYSQSRTTFDLFCHWPCVFFTPLGLGRNLLSFTKWGQQRSIGAVKRITHLLQSQDPIIQSLCQTDWTEQREKDFCEVNLLLANLNYLLSESIFHQQCQVSPESMPYNHLITYVHWNPFFASCHCRNKFCEAIHPKRLLKLQFQRPVTRQSGQFSSLTEDYWELVWIDV